MSSQRSIDSKREEFRKYLENTGVMDTLCRILTIINEGEIRPKDALQFFRDQFIQCTPLTTELQITQKYLESAREKINLLESENVKLKEELENCKKKTKVPSKE